MRQFLYRLRTLLPLTSLMGIRVVTVLVYRLFCDFLWGRGFRRYEVLRMDAIRKYLDSHYLSLLHSILNEAQGDRVIPPRIWVFWYQGEQYMPAIPQLCLSAIRRHASDAEVTLLTQSNMNQWVDIPDYIYQKVKTGRISLAQLSDIVRAHLLGRYGGIWMDATLLPVKDLDYSGRCGEFFSIGTERVNGKVTISDYRWTGFFLCAPAQSRVFSAMAGLFLAYWKENDRLIDYLLIDYWLDMIYRHDEDFRKCVDSQPHTHPFIHSFVAMLGDEFNELQWEECIAETGLFKLDFRIDPPCVHEGRETVYGYLRRQYL